MIGSPMEVVALVLIIGLTALITIGIYRAGPPSNYDREAERRQMREERRRPRKERQ